MPPPRKAGNRSRHRRSKNNHLHQGNDEQRRNRICGENAKKKEPGDPNSLGSGFIDSEMRKVTLHSRVHIICFREKQSNLVIPAKAGMTRLGCTWEYESLLPSTATYFARLGIKK